MRTIFFRLLISFALTVLLTGLISGAVLYSLSRRSVDSFRHDFHRQLQANIARSVVLMGQAAQVMRRYQGDAAFATYLREIETSMRTRLYLCIDDQIVPEGGAGLQERIRQLNNTLGEDTYPYVEEDGRELLVAQRLRSPEDAPYLVFGLHKLGPPPGMEKGPPPPHEGKGPPPPPPDLERGIDLLGQVQGVRFAIFVAVAGVICYLLARSFSTPLARLRRISRQIADGNLSARIGDSLGKPGNEIGDLARDFDHMAERMEGLVNGQKRLLLDISHELRSPLARLNLALELARKRFQAEDDGNLARIARESERLNTLIGQLLTLTRSDAFTVDAAAPPVKLADLLLEIAEDVDFETRPLHKGVAITALEPAQVAGSRELLRQAIENIVRNGAAYTRPDSRVEIVLATREGQKTGTREAVIRVRDYGPGVPEEKLGHLTEPFFRVAEARDRNSGGVGMGLAIAAEAVQQHGGTLQFTNAPNREGLIVDIVLPLREHPAA
jgi:two-component system sensor histidine kinase CpxA